MKKVIVAIGAHLDDIELAAGGTLAKAVKDGHDIHMIVMSQSGYTDYNGKVMRTDETAMNEGRNAARVLGCKDLDILDFTLTEGEMAETAKLNKGKRYEIAYLSNIFSIGTNICGKCFWNIIDFV